MNLVWLKLIKRILTHKYYVAYDQQTKDAELQGCLKTVFVDGELVREYSLSEIRERVNSTLV